MLCPRHGPSLSEPSREFQLLLGRPHSRAEPAPGRARPGWAMGRAAGSEAVVPPEPQHNQDHPQERLAALTMPPWFPRGLLPSGVGGPCAPPTPPLPRQPRAERSSDGPLLGPRVTPVPRGPQRAGERCSGRERTILEASCPDPKVRAGRDLAQPWAGGLGPPWLLCQCAWPARSCLCAKLAPLLSPGWQSPG